MKTRIYQLPLLLTLFVSNLINAQMIPTKCVKLVNQPLVLVDQATGNGVSKLILRNQLSTPVNLAITAAFSPTTSSRTELQFGSTETSAPSPVSEASIQPKSTISIFLFVKNDWNDGQQDIELFNHYGLESMGKIHVQRVPFSMSVNDPKLNLSLIGGQATQISLTNDTSIRYAALQWALLNGKTICGGNLEDVGPRSTTILNCTPPKRWSLLAFARAIKPEGMRDGYRLIIFPKKPPPLLSDAPTVVLAQFSGRAAWEFFHPETYAILKYVIIFLLLALGGLASLALSYYLPNKLQRLDLREKLLQLAIRTSGMSSRIPSRLAVIVRLERSRLTALLQSRSAFSPDFGTIAKRCATGVQQLGEKVAILEQIDNICGLLEEAQVEGVPPTRVDAINTLIDTATVLLEGAEMRDDDLGAARKAIALAFEKANHLTDADDAFGTGLAAGCQSIVADLVNQPKNDAYVAMESTLLPILGVLTAVNVQIVNPQSYLEVDYAWNKAKIILRYLRLRSGLTNTMALNRLLLHTDTLIALLQRSSWDGLGSARLLLHEMDDDIYPERIIDVFKSYSQQAGSHELGIEVDPPYVYENTPVEFSLRFCNRELDSCAAREEFIVEWHFDDERSGKGWFTSHYFLRRKTDRRWGGIQPFQVVARVFTSDGSVIPDLQIEKTVIVHVSELGRGAERTRTELIKLGVALLIAVLGLVSGAQSQIDKLDLIPGLAAVFLVGFSADSIKRLLTS